MKGRFSRAGRNTEEAGKQTVPDWREKCEKLERQLEEMTKRNNERNNYINSVFSSMEDGFFLIDTEGRIVLFNKSAGKLLDINDSCLFGDAGESQGEVMRYILDQCRIVQRDVMPKTLETRNAQNLDLQVSISPVMSKYGDKSLIGILAITKDITERKKVENVRKEFVATVSHEFRTPLTLISGFIEMLRMYDNIQPEDRNRSLEILEIETERLKKLVSELLLLSKMENRISTGKSGQGAIDVEKVLAQVMTVLRPLAEKKRHDIEASVSVSFPIIYGDENWLFHAVHNLVENAVKYTPEEGKIRIRACNDDKELSISVADSGIGIAESDMDRIFERFYRADHSRGSHTGGSGLGLAIAKDIVSIFNGNITVESRLGSGSTFIIHLPL